MTDAPLPPRPLSLKPVFLPRGGLLGLALYDAETDQLIGDQVGLAYEQNLAEGATVTVTFRIGGSVQVAET